MSQLTLGAAVVVSLHCMVLSILVCFNWRQSSIQLLVRQLLNLGEVSFVSQLFLSRPHNIIDFTKPNAATAVDFPDIPHLMYCFDSSALIHLLVVAHWQTVYTR